MSKVEPGSYVVCETAAAITLHVRQGVFQPCGKQDSYTFCAKRPAWDTRIPVGIFDEATGDTGTRRCRVCMEAYREAKADGRG